MARSETFPVSLFLLILSFFSCSQAPKVSILVSDIPEMALYAEVYNSSQTGYRIVAEFAAAPAEVLSSSQPKGDLVVAQMNFPPGFQDKLAPMDYIFDRSGSAREDFYPGVLEMGSLSGTQYMVPLSFNLPLIMGLADSFPAGWPGLLVEMDDIISHSSGQNRPQKNPPALGYSLRWSSRQVESLLFRHRTGSLILPDGTLSLASLSTAPVLEMLSRHRKLNGDEFEDRFTSKYLPGQGYKLLTDRRVVFYPTDIRDFLSLPASQTSGMAVRYPALDGKTMAAGPAVMMALSRRSSQRDAAEDFAAWLLKPEVQLKLLDLTADLQLKTFGLAGGLSALTAVTESRTLQGMGGPALPLPPATSIRFPPALPLSWDSFRAEVADPWISRSLEGAESESLEESHRRWLQEKNVDSTGKPL